MFSTIYFPDPLPGFQYFCQNIHFKKLEQVGIAGHLEELDHNFTMFFQPKLVRIAQTFTPCLLS